MAENFRDHGDDTKEPTEGEKLQQKLFGYLAGAMTSNLIALGDTLGLYAELKRGKLTSQQLADAKALNERFVREWLFQQASAGCVSTDAEAHTFWLSEPQAQVLANEHGSDASPLFLGGMFQHVPELISAPANARLIESWRSGVGFGYDAMGADNACSTCRSLGVWVRHYLVSSLNAMPGLEALLQAGATVADIGCGAGELLFTLAKAFPKGRYHGYDISTKSLQLANERAFCSAEPCRKQKNFADLDMTVANLMETGGKQSEFADLDITFLNPLEAGGALPEAPTYDLAITMDAVHDMAHPAKVVSAVRKALKPEALYIVNDPRGKAGPAANVHDNPGPSTLFYGFSNHACLPSSMSEPGGTGFGTLGFQEPQARELAAQSGFTRFEVANWESSMNNVFVMRP